MNTDSPLIVLGVAGGIAAYKSCELARTLIKAGCRVKVVMTENATRFVGPTTFRALTGNPVGVSMWDEPGDDIHHISLANEADLVLVAPATANVLAKMAAGRADDLLTTTVLATTAPVMVAPAMNVKMWRALATTVAVGQLRSRGVHVVEPESGQLACGDVGEGRMAEPGSIAAAVLEILRNSASLSGITVLVTAGPTCEPFDPVRFISNGSSGKTGFAIAQAAKDRGARVLLVTGPVSLRDPFDVDVHRVTTAQEMYDCVHALIDQVDVMIATAAVSDYRPAEPLTSKYKKGASDLSVRLVENPDILASVGRIKGERILVGYCAETDDIVLNAQQKLVSKNADLVVANDISNPHIGFGSDDNSVTFVTKSGHRSLPAMAKTQIARELLDVIASMLGRPHPLNGERGSVQ